MSITVSTDVFCEYCEGWIHGITISVVGKAAPKYARAVAKQAGWTYKEFEGRMVDICPSCQKRDRTRQ